MEFIPKPNSTSPLWEYFGFKLNKNGEPINLNEPAYRQCSKIVATETDTDPPTHLLHKVPTQLTE